MKRIIFGIISALVIGFLLQASPCSAANFYIAQTAAGSGSGASCANAYAYTWFNTFGNWAYPKTAGKLGPGDTVHLCGTIGSQLQPNGGGSAGSPLTILFEPGAKLSSPAWPYSAIQLPAGIGYLIIDGGATGPIGGVKGNPANVNGIIENTANGTGLANQVGDVAISATQGANNLTIQNLAISNLYVRTSLTDTQADSSGITIQDGGQGVNNILITNCLMHDMQGGINVAYGAGNSNFAVSNTTVYNANWGAGIGDLSSSASLAGLVVHDCYFHDWANWDSSPPSYPDIGYHHNGVYAWVNNYGAVLANPTFYNNVVGPGYGVNQTSGLWADHATGATMFNNLFVCGAGETAATGLLVVDTSVPGTIFNIYNNTFIVDGNNAVSMSPVAIYASAGGSGTSPVFNIKNNLAYGSANDGIFINMDGNSHGTIVSDYNLLFGFSSSPFVYSSSGSNSWLTFSQWKTATGGDSHTVTSNPNLSGTYTLNSGSPAIGAGANLTSLGITALDSDASGNARSSSSMAWDIGAYAYGSSGGGGAPPGGGGAPPGGGGAPPGGGGFGGTGGGGIVNGSMVNGSTVN